MEFSPWAASDLDAEICASEENLGPYLKELDEDLFSQLDLASLDGKLEENEEGSEDESLEDNPRGTVTVLREDHSMRRIALAEDSGEQLHPADLNMAFTVKDEFAEIASMTASEMATVNSDLLGITADMSKLGIQQKSSDLQKLEDELSRLPPEQTAAYAQAMTECPGLVSDKRKMAFLERENNNPALAATRLASYWEFRLEIFGPERCFLPMTLSGAMKEEAKNMVKRRTVQLLPVTDTAGRAILFFDPSRRDFSVYSVEQEIMAIWYLLEVAMEDPEMLRNGVVLVFNERHIQQKHTSRTFTRLSVKFDSVFPMRCRGIHCCYSSFFANFIVHPVAKLVMGRDFRRRFKLHYGETNEVLDSLAGYRLPKDRLPVDIGGDLTLDMEKWVSDRMALEKSRSDPRLISEEERIIVPDGSAAKRPRNDPPAAVESKFKRKGQNNDPRMYWALQIRLEDPDLPLTDVLLQAGFSFHKKNDFGQEVDDDNVTIAQRKNNLCRRVRREKEKLRQVAEGTSTVEVQAAGECSR